jgi:hypothetical protein
LRAKEVIKSLYNYCALLGINMVFGRTSISAEWLVAVTRRREWMLEAATRQQGRGDYLTHGVGHIQNKIVPFVRI